MAGFAYSYATKWCAPLRPGAGWHFRCGPKPYTTLTYRRRILVQTMCTILSRLPYA